MSAFPSVDSRRAKPRADEVIRLIPLANGAQRRERYDLLGRLTSQDEPDGAWLRYRYDAKGRLQSVVHSSGERADYEFDERANTWTARTADTTTTFRLSPDGLPLEVLLRIEGQDFSARYRYDSRRQVAACLYPQGDDWLEVVREDEDTLRLACGAQEYCRVTNDREERATTLDFVNGARTVEALSADKLRQVERVTISDGEARVAVSVPLRYDDEGRLCSAAGARFEYDAAGHIARFDDGAASRAYEYDATGRLLRVRHAGGGADEFLYDEAPLVIGVNEEGGGRVRFEYDAAGRRVARRDECGETRYTYNLFGQPSRVELPSGRTVEYLYDGFGRLVARKCGGEVSYYVVGFEGRRLAETDAEGCVARSYLWLGQQCVGSVRGPMGGAEFESYHRGHCGRLAARGDASGALQVVEACDPFGGDAPVEDGLPAYACLFGDPETGLLYANARWLDPTVAQFITPDTWCGTDVSRRMPRRLRGVLEAMPGGPSEKLSPEVAYNYCGYDPVNFNDPYGHSVGGQIWSFFSSILWNAQLTHVSLQLQLLNLTIGGIGNLIQLGYGLGEEGEHGVAYKHSFLNTNPPVHSDRQNVLWALMLNGLFNFQSVPWTLGNVIWARRVPIDESDGAALEPVSEYGKRDLLICPNAASYVASSEERAADILRARNTGAVAGADVTNVDGSTTGGAMLAAVAVTAPAGTPPSGDVLKIGDWVDVQLAAGGTAQEVRRILNVAHPNIELEGPALPAPFAPAGAPPVPVRVNLTRLDMSVAKITKSGDVLGRSITFIRGNALHMMYQMPKHFASGNVTVEEFMPEGKREEFLDVSLPRENILIRKNPYNQSASWNTYAANDFLRVEGASFRATKLVSIRDNRDLVVDPEVVFVPTPPKVKVVKMTDAAQSAAGQRVPAAGARVECGDNTGQLKDLAKGDGLEADNTPPTAQVKRIAEELFLNCKFDAAPLTAPANLVAAPFADIRLELMHAGTNTAGTMKDAGADKIEMAAAGAAAIGANHWVVVERVSDNLKAYAYVRDVDAEDAAHKRRLLLRAALTPPGFGNGVAVRVAPLSPTLTFEVELADRPVVGGVPGPDVFVLVKVTNQTLRCKALNSGDALRVYRSGGAADSGAVAPIKAVPVIVAGLDMALPATHTANLTVKRFTPDNNSLQEKATLPEATRHIRLRAAPATAPYGAGKPLFVSGQDAETFAVFDSITGREITLREPIETAGFYRSVRVFAVRATGTTTLNAVPDEAKVLMPADPSQEMTRRRALEEHEMRHVWQGTNWGPMLLSLPIPWLTELGFFAGSAANTGSKVLRFLRLGGVDSILGLLIGMISTGAQGEPLVGTDMNGVVADNTRKIINLPVDPDPQKIGRFSAGRFVVVTKGGSESDANIEAIEAAQPAANGHVMKLSEALDTSLFSPGDAVQVNVSPIDQVFNAEPGKTIKTIFDVLSMNFEPLWRRLLPNNNWVRLFSKSFNPDSWLPGTGLYVLAFIFNAGNRYNIFLEQDASYHSGDVYTTIVKSVPAKEIFAGEFARIYAFLQSRESGVSRVRYLLGSKIAGGKVANAARDEIDTLPAGVNQRLGPTDHLVKIEKADDSGVSFYTFATTLTPTSVQLREPLPGRFSNQMPVSIFIHHDEQPNGEVSSLWVELPTGKGSGKMQGTDRNEIKMNSEDDVKKFLAFQRVLVTKAGDPPAAAVISDTHVGNRTLKLLDALPAAFTNNTNVEVEVVASEVDVAGSYSELASVRGKVQAGAPLREIELPAIPVAPFEKDEKVRVLKVGAAPELAFVTSVESLTAKDQAHDKITLKDALPSRFAANDDVRVIPHRVYFTTNYRIPMNDYIENTLGAFFATSRPGVYEIKAPDMKGVDYIGHSKLKVKPLRVSTTPSAPVYETEEIAFSITGVAGFSYKLGFVPASTPLVPATDGEIDPSGRRYIAPMVAPATPPRRLQILATYEAGNAVFTAPGQKPSRIPADRLTNVCHEVDLKLQTITVPPIGPVRARSVTALTMPIAMRTWRVTNIAPALPVGVANPSVVIQSEGRPPTVSFVAPAVTARTTLDLVLTFGTNADHQKTVTLNITVNP